MKPQTELERQNPDRIVELLLHHTTKEELKQLVEAAAAASGETVSGSAFEPGDDICPTFKFPFPLPHGFSDFLGQLVSKRIGVVVFPLGIVNPEAVLVQARTNVSE